MAISDLIKEYSINITAVNDGNVFHNGTVIPKDETRALKLIGYKEYEVLICDHAAFHVYDEECYLGSDPNRKYEYYDLSIEDLEIDIDGRVYYYNKTYQRNAYLYVFKKDSEVLGFGALDSKSIIASSFEFISIDINRRDSVWIQTGANSQQGLYIQFVDATVAGLEIENADVTTNENATKLLSTTDAAIEKVSEYRNKFGTYQNRLEHAYDNNTNSSENLQVAESKIRDADMAKLMVEYAKNDILIQAGQSMLAQANRINEGVVRLLQ